jgi:signal transduction histidine kinase
MAFSLPQLSYRRLRITVIVVLVVLICVPVVMAGLSLFWIAEGSITHEVEDRLTSLASDQAARLTDWIEEREFDLGAIGHLTALNYWARQATQSDPRAGDSLAAILERVRLVFGGRYLRFGVFGNNGLWQCPDTLTYPRDAAVLAAIQAGMTYITTDHPYPSDSGLPLLSVYAPVVDQDLSRHAFLVAAISPGPLYQLLQHSHAGMKLGVYLLDSSGATLSRTKDAMSVLPKNCPLLRQRGTKSRTTSGVVRCNAEEGRSVIGAYQNLPRLGWTILVQRDYGEVFDGLNRLRWVLWLTMGIIFLLAVGVSTMVANVTVRTLERREVELRSTNEQLITADRLASVGMMAASVAHEINNPLTTIKVLIHSVREQTQPDDPKNGDLGIVAGEIDKIKALVLRFLQFARPREPEFSPVRLDEILSRIASLMRPQAQINGVDLTEQYDPQTSSVRADGAQIGQVFVNILLNALEATPRGGEIRITTAPAGEGGIRVTIWNSGPGLPSELEERIFEPFFSTKPTGTGLGLSIARIIIDNHQGTLSAQGHGENGTTFTITLHGRGKETDNAPRSGR